MLSLNREDTASTFTINAHTIQLKTSPSLGRDFLPNLTYSDAHFQISHSISPTRLCLLHVYLNCLSDAHLIFMRNVSDCIYHSTNRLRPHCIHYSWAAVLKWTVNAHTISEPIRRSHNKTSVIHIVYSDVALNEKGLKYQCKQEFMSTFVCSCMSELR